jgi:2-keto-3-deoxy-L-rhamnonate aldolase RhmA
MKPNSLRIALDTRAPALGTLILLETGATARVLARAGYTFLVFDVQHAAFDVARAEALLGAVRGTDCAALARVHPGRPDQIEQYLDLGAHGVVVPMVSSEADAKRAVDACRFPPIGRRSVGGMRNLLERDPDYPAAADRDVVCVIQIEDVAAVERLDSILAVPGIDAVMPGPVDLARSMGHVIRYGGVVPEVAAAAIAQAEQRIDECCLVHGIPVIPAAGTDEQFAQSVDRGHRIVCFSSDLHMLQAVGAEHADVCTKLLNAGTVR